jgi:hypothetical protein
MEKETLKKIFNFLENQEHKTPKGKGSISWKLTFNEPFTEEDLTTKNRLNFSNSLITYLPEGLKVGGFLDLYYCKNLISLPEGLKVKYYLNLEGTKITSLPKGLEVEGHLFIRDTPLKKYTDKELRDMVKPGFIKGEIRR